MGQFSIRGKKGGNVRNSRVTHPKARDRKDRAAERLIPDMDPVLQLKRLDERLGVGVGAVKERAKLLAKINASKVEKAIPVEVVEKPKAPKRDDRARAEERFQKQALKVRLKASQR